MSLTPGAPRKLRLIRPLIRQKISENLKPLVQNNKKKLAQTLYYQNHPEHQSPLMRSERGPVHQRLGIKQIRLRRLVPLGTSTASVLPKKKFVHYTNPSDNKFKRQKLQRRYTAQARLERIRAQQPNGSIKLRRFNGGISTAKNFTVEVKNSNFVPFTNGTDGPKLGSFYKFKMVLNTQIQNEIRDIQQGGNGPLSPLPALTRIIPVTTGIETSIRFGLL